MPGKSSTLLINTLCFGRVYRTLFGETDSCAAGLPDNLESGSNSPRLATSSTAHLDDSSEDGDRFEEASQGHSHGHAGYREQWKGQHGDESLKLPDAGITPELQTPGEYTPSEGGDGMLPRDMQRKTAYYDYAAEKSMSQADAKLFYQRSQIEAQRTVPSSQINSPVIKARRASTTLHAEQPIHRSGSMHSAHDAASMSHRYIHPYHFRQWVQRTD